MDLGLISEETKLEFTPNYPLPWHKQTTTSGNNRLQANSTVDKNRTSFPPIPGCSHALIENNTEMVNTNRRIKKESFSKKIIRQNFIDTEDSRGTDTTTPRHNKEIKNHKEKTILKARTKRPEGVPPLKLDELSVPAERASTPVTHNFKIKTSDLIYETPRSGTIASVQH